MWAYNVGDSVNIANFVKNSSIVQIGNKDFV